LEHLLQQQGITPSGESGDMAALQSQAAATWMDFLFRAILHASWALASESSISSSFFSQLVAQLLKFTLQLAVRCWGGVAIYAAAQAAIAEYAGARAVACWPSPFVSLC
jgi:hypothetical protein